MSSNVCKKLIKHAQAIHERSALLLVDQRRLAPAEVHQLRVSVKELRALWRVLKSFLAKGQAGAASRDIRGAARLLAGARDQYVHLETLDRLIDKAGDEDLPSLRQARNQLVEHQTASTEDVLMTADIVSRFTRDRERWQGLELTLSCSRKALICDGCRRLYRRARKLFRKAVASGKADDWHRLRRLTKYLAMVLPVVVDDGTADAEAKQYAVLAKKLGDLNDLHVMAASLTALPDQDDPLLRRTIALVERRSDSLQSKCQKKSRRLFGHGSARTVIDFTS